mmetsp:Transcript_29538/g.75186  ORF Transcript_29538/g.75186 Transcript_29538/m.75186 type:complete len:603 (-) Transcript_29538:68-1876(-)
MPAAEHGSVASGVDDSLYPVAVLIDELRHDDLQLRLNSIRNLRTIAVALGAERTREELLPFLQEIIDDEDEVLIALADQLGCGVDWVGGPQFAHALTGPLEELCNVEEISVREKATEALKSLVKEMSQEQMVRHFCALIHRLASSESYTSRISVCSLFSAALPKVGDSKQDDLLKCYCRLCGDETPMVRRQAANVLGTVAQVVTQDSMFRELITVFVQLSGDEQDSVRILAISNCIALGKLKSTPEWQAQILPIMKVCTEDKSWRVRYMMADNVKQLCEVFESQATSSIIPLYLTLLSDHEVEVRMIAAARIADVAAFSPTKEFLETLLPVMEKLTLPREQSHVRVRASLAGSVLGLTPIFGATLTVDYLIKVFLQLIRDESPEVRLKLIGTLGELSSVVGIDVLSQSLLPSIKELGKDRQWRVRLAVIDCMPSLAQYLGEASFTSELSGLFQVWLVDPVFSVRDAAAGNFKRLSEVLGLPWCEINVVPQLQKLLEHKNYLYRISAVSCTGALAVVAGGPLLEKHLVPMVLKMAGDPVPNVRFNAAKTIQAMHKSCASASPSALQDSLVPCLRRLGTDEDPDVQFYAKRTLSEIPGATRTPL